MAVNEDDYIGFRVDPDTGERHELRHLQESATWEPQVYQFEDGDKLIGGTDGIDNLPLQELANRTRYLYGLVRKLVKLIPVESVLGTTFSQTQPTNGTVWVAAEDGEGGTEENSSALIVPEDGQSLQDPLARVLLPDGTYILTRTNWGDEDGLSGSGDTPDTPVTPTDPTADEAVTNADIDNLFKA